MLSGTAQALQVARLLFVVARQPADDGLHRLAGGVGDGVVGDAQRHRTAEYFADRHIRVFRGGPLFSPAPASYAGPGSRQGSRRLITSRTLRNCWRCWRPPVVAG